MTDSVLQGVLRKGQEIEVRPGIVSRDSEGRATCVPIYSRIVTLLAEQNDLQYAVPGGLIGVGTTVSPCPLCMLDTSSFPLPARTASLELHP